MQVHTITQGPLSSSTLLFFIPLCPRFESPCPSAVAQFAAHVPYNSASLA